MNPNSALHWLPAIQKLSLPIPFTEIIPFNYPDMFCMLDGECNEAVKDLMAKLDGELEAEDGPLFVRTDLAAAKHSGPRGYLLRPGHARRLLFTLIEDNEMKFGFSADQPKALLVRRFLELEHRFTAFRGLPIAREWRLFATAQKVLCRHFYWPADALQGHIDGHDIDESPEEEAYWREKLKELEEWLPEMNCLDAMAIEAAAACGPVKTWSVDFARDVNGKFWLIDMATAKDSWHPEDCPHKVIK